ncbi:MAG: ATP-binding protein [Calothrix sp. MO_167.B12]|nr:ATP-binding protein [Calothrix sp. MO_167.B12]
MSKLRQSSFRRILVSRILLIFVPVLLVGEILALNKARSSLLATARKNLTASATSRGDEILVAIASLKTNLQLASQTVPLKTGSLPEIEEFLIQLSRQLPNRIQCIQLTDVSNGNLINSTCSDKPIAQLQLPLSDEGFQVATVLSPKSGITGRSNQGSQLQLLLSVPVYNSKGKLIYGLSVQSVVYQQKTEKPGSLMGNTIIIAADGTILAHPQIEKVGKDIAKIADEAKVQKIIQNAISGENKPINLNFKSSGESIIGYAAIPNIANIQPQQQWIVITFTSLDNALLGLEEIKLILIVLTVGLIAASLLTSLYVAPYLARPVEKLRDYALNLHLHQEIEPIPHDLEIREFNQLAQALNQMVERLKAWADELELAWKEAKNANQVKSQFLATTSHELRNPLNIIINCIRLVTDGLCDNREEEMDFLQRADETAIHLLGIINDILDISKIEAGKLSVVTEPTDLRKLLLEVINLQSVNIQQKGLQLQCQLVDKEIPVNVDPAKLKQVIINIIGNATKFTNEGSISVNAEIQPSDIDEYVAIVTVKDTGIGIDPSQQSKLFRPFVMVDNRSTRKFSGTGLGLAISRNLIELMGGSITLSSEGINQGTTVTITLPLINKSLLSTPPIDSDDSSDDNGNEPPQKLEASSNNDNGNGENLENVLNPTSSYLPGIKTPI